jgi:hypothetical protein
LRAVRGQLLKLDCFAALAMTARHCERSEAIQNRASSDSRSNNEIRSG